MSNVFWRCILDGAPEMQRKNQKKRQAKKKHVRHVNIFMVIPHNLRIALGSSEIFKMDCICIRQGVEESVQEGGCGEEKGFYMPHMKSICKCCTKREVSSLQGLTWKFDFFSLSPALFPPPPLFHWLRWWCTYCLLVNMIKIQISHYGKYMCVCGVCVSRWNVKCGKKLPEGNCERRTLRNETYTVRNLHISLMLLLFLFCAEQIDK